MLAGVIERELATAQPFVDYSGLYDKRYAEAIKGGRTEQQAHDDAIQSVQLSANWDCPGTLAADDVRALVDWHRVFVRGDDQMFVAWQAIQRCQRGQRQDDEAGAIESGYPFAWHWHPERIGELEDWHLDVIKASQHAHNVAQAWIDSWSKPEATSKAIKAIKPNTYEPASSAHLAQRCKVIGNSFETGGRHDTEPLWFGVLKCVAAAEPDISVEVSDQHPKFSLAELGDRMERIESERLKPATCAYLSDHSDLCSQCEWFGKIRSPMKLAFDHLPKVAS
jgi:hypothetical protein